MTPQASIIINTYNRPEPLSRCLEAVSRQDGVDHCEVIVVDDGSRGNFHAIERLWQRKLDLKFIPIKHSGRATARNRGVEAAKGERIIFLGDDVMVKPGWLKCHLERGIGQKYLALLGPYALMENRSYSSAFRAAVDPVRFDWIKNPEDVGFEFFFTGNISMDRGLFNEIGGFDTRFTTYGWEDIDFGLRFKKSGGKIIYDECAKAVHEHPAMTRSELWKREYSNGYTAWIFWEKWNTDPEIAFMKFWSDKPNPGPAWRRRLGEIVIEIIERWSPDSAWMFGLYERVMYSNRHAGAAAASVRSNK